MNYTVDTNNQRFSKKNGSTVEEYYLWNTDGQLVGVADAANRTVEQEVKYDEFGRVLSDTSPGFTPFGFAGGDTNLYGYVLQDPVNYIDPEGLAQSMPFGGGGIPGGGAPAGAMPGGGGAAIGGGAAAAAAAAILCSQQNLIDKCNKMLINDALKCAKLPEKLPERNACFKRASDRYDKCIGRK